MRGRATLSEISYRLAVESDVPALAEMRWTWRTAEDGTRAVVSHEDYVKECCAFLRQGLAEGSWLCWIAEVEGQFVSHIFVRRVRKVPKPSRLHDEIGYVTNVYTRPPYRGQGVGSALLACVVQWARDQEIDVLFVWPSQQAVPFYERAGFRADNEILECQIRPD
jgi:GNAT superfamily N-acetyltransferase